jgi:hypothetical protein
MITLPEPQQGIPGPAVGNQKPCHAGGNAPQMDRTQMDRTHAGQPQHRTGQQFDPTHIGAQNSK